MRSLTLISKAIMVLVATLYLITCYGFSEIWAKSSSGKSKSASRVTAAPATAKASSSKNVRAKKKKSSDQLEYMKYEMKDAVITGY